MNNKISLLFPELKYYYSRKNKNKNKYDFTVFGIQCDEHDYFKLNIVMQVIAKTSE